MAFYYLVGEGFNIIDGAETTTPTSVDTLFPVANLHSDDQGEVFRFNTPGASDAIKFDLNRLFGGDFETWSTSVVPDDWTDESVGTGAISEEEATGNVNNGQSSLKLDSTGAGNDAVCTQEVEVLSGWVMTFVGSIMGDGSGHATTIVIRNLHTGSYLTSGGVWQAGAVNFGSETDASFVQKTAVFTVEPFSTSLRHKVTLKITISYVDSNAAGYADDFYMWPHWDFASIHGHNMGGAITPELHASGDDFVGDDDEIQTTGFLIKRPSFYDLLAAMETKRYAKFVAAGTNWQAIEIGALVLGQKKTLAQAQRIPYTIDPRLEQIQVTSMGGHTSKTALAEDESETLRLNFRLSTTDYETFRDEIQRRTKQGSSSGVIVSDDINGKVHYGKFGSSFPTRHINSNYYDVSATFHEDGFVIRAN